MILVHSSTSEKVADTQRDSSALVDAMAFLERNEAVGQNIVWFCTNCVNKLIANFKAMHLVDGATQIQHEL